MRNNEIDLYISIYIKLFSIVFLDDFSCITKKKYTRKKEITLSQNRCNTKQSIIGNFLEHFIHFVWFDSKYILHLINSGAKDIQKLVEEWKIQD